MQEKFQILMQKLDADVHLAEKLMAQETPEEVQALLKEAGFEFSIAEIMELRDGITKLIELSEGGELSEEVLEGVAGGAGEVMGKQDVGSQPWYAQPGQAYINFSHDAGRSIDNALRYRVDVRRVFRRRW